jgi:hypothetical protein
LLAESEILEQKSLLPHEERPDRGPDDGQQERHLPKLAKAENVNDINGMEFSRTTGRFRVFDRDTGPYSVETQSAPSAQPC